MKGYMADPAKRAARRAVQLHYEQEYNRRPGRRERKLESGKRSAVKAKYGLTLEKYAELLRDPCGICGGPSGTLDHNHVTGRVRGALCDNCNKGMGCLRDDVALLKAAIRWLETRN